MSVLQKRIIMAFVIFAASFVPVSYSLSGGFLGSDIAGAASISASAFAPKLAVAVTPPPSCPAGEIKVSVPVFTTNQNGQSNPYCVPNNASTGGAIVFYLELIIKLATGAVGLVILLMMIVGGVQYITASGNPALVKAARTRITNSIIALVLFLMAYAILNFLLPSGVLTI